MPTVRGVLGRMRRTSLPVIPRSAKPTQQQNVPSFRDQYYLSRSQSAPDDTHIRHADEQTGIFSLPVELQTQVFLAVQYLDLCAFRATNRRARDLLQDGEIVRQWINQNADGHQLELWPPPENVTFQYLLDQQKRAKEAVELATEISDYIARQMLDYTLRRLDVYRARSRDEVFELVRKQLNHKMRPLILTVRHYLERCAAGLIRTTRVTGAQFRNVFLAQASEVVSSYDVEHVFLVHKFWMFLAWLMNQLLRRPSYAGTVERAFRGWLRDGPVNLFDFRLFLIFGNIRALTQLIRADDPNDRRKLVEESLSRLDPERPWRNIQWQQHWQNTGATAGMQVTKEQTDLILNLELTERELWVESAHKLLVKNGIIEMNNENDEIPVGTPWQMVEFLCDAGYEVMNLPST